LWHNPHHSVPPDERGARMRPIRRHTLALLTACSLVTVPLAMGLLAQSQRAAVAADTKGRDLAMATPESVGVSSERLRRLESEMKRIVDHKQIAGIVTLLERHGKVVHFGAVGQKDVRKPDAIQKDSIF